MAGETELHDAILWKATDDGLVQCSVCAHRCRIPEWGFGICRVRHNVGRKLKTLTYDHVISMNADPIEKKPLFHFLPGTSSFSIATPGCNFTCNFCQNWKISQAPKDGTPLGGQAVSPGELVNKAVSSGCKSISYTYTEPAVFIELAMDTSRLAKKQGLRNCFVSNGFMTPEAVEHVAPYVDAMNVDLKCFSEETYKDICGGHLQPVLDCLKNLIHAGIWVEVTTLVVPGMNDSPEELKQIADFIRSELGAGVPWHVSRFHGDYNMSTRLPTSVETLELAYSLGREAGITVYLLWQCTRGG